MLIQGLKNIIILKFRIWVLGIIWILSFVICYLFSNKLYYLYAKIKSQEVLCVCLDWFII